MLKYFHIIKFLMTHDLTFLKECLSVECLHNKDYSLRRVITRLMKKHPINYLIEWRIANEMYKTGNDKLMKLAYKIQNSLIVKYNVEISLGCNIGKGLKIAHYSSIVLHRNVDIGENLYIAQCVTIGQKKDDISIKIGNNVTIGCNSVILGGDVKIGNNVKIGAMSYIDKGIPDNCTVFTKKTNEIIIR